MSGPAAPQIIVRTGAADPPSMSLEPGQPVGPLSIGRRGTWRLVAPGVLEEHGFVYFNGTELFLQSTDPLSPVLADGAPVPGAWTAVRAPCEIAVGGARLWFGLPEPTFTPRVQGNDFEAATRVQPLEETRHARGPLPAAGSPFAAPQPVLGPGAPPPLGFIGGDPRTPGPAGLIGGDPGTPANPPAGLPVAPPAPPSFLAARWREASGPKKALFVLMVPLVWAVWVIFTDAPVAPPAPKPAASAAGQPSAAPRSSAPAAAEPAPATEAPPGSSRAGASPAASTSPATTGPKTPQREAADAVAAGAFDRAAKLYDDLATAHPEVPAYAEAARILKARAGKR